MQNLGIYQHILKLISCPLLLKRQSCTYPPTSCICSGACGPCLTCFRHPFCVSCLNALTNPMKKGEITEEGEEGESEDSLRPKELGLVVLGCRRQTDRMALLCDLGVPCSPGRQQLCSEQWHKHIQTLSILQLELLLKEAIKCSNFLLGFAHLKTKLNFLKPVLPLLAPK